MTNKVLHPRKELGMSFASEEVNLHRITFDGNNNTSRNEIIIDFGKFHIAKEGRFCIANLQLKIKSIRKLNLNCSETIGVYIELPQHLKLKGEDDLGEGNGFKKITETRVDAITKTKGKYYVFDPVTYDLCRGNKTDSNTDSNIGYMYLEYKLRNTAPTKIDPKTSELQITCEYAASANNRQKRNGCMIL